MKLKRRLILTFWLLLASLLLYLLLSQYTLLSELFEAQGWPLQMLATHINGFAVILILSFFFSALLILGIAQSVSIPLEKLRKAAEAVARGEAPELDATLFEGDEEIAGLANSLREMGARLPRRAKKT